MPCGGRRAWENAAVRLTQDCGPIEAAEAAGERMAKKILMLVGDFRRGLRSDSADIILPLNATYAEINPRDYDTRG
jgi:hypothetical protein